MTRDRQSTLLWMKDLIEHMSRCHEQLQWTSEGPSAAFLAEAMQVDLAECLKLCETLKDHPQAKRRMAMA